MGLGLVGVGYPNAFWLPTHLFADYAVEWVLYLKAFGQDSLIGTYDTQAAYVLGQVPKLHRYKRVAGKCEPAADLTNQDSRRFHCLLYSPPATPATRIPGSTIPNAPALP